MRKVYLKAENLKSPVAPYFKQIKLLKIFLISFYFFQYSQSFSQSISAGYIHSIASDKDGEIYYWGSELGSRIYENSKVPENISNTGPLAGKKIKLVAAALDHSLVLTNDGLVYAWGSNFYGTLGNNSLEESHIPVQVHNLSDVISISTFAEHSLALKADGTVWAWGKGINGELGDGIYYLESPFCSIVPVQVKGLENIVAVSAGSNSSIALRADGKVLTWGSGIVGQLGNGLFNSQTHTPIEVPFLENIVSVSMGSLHAMALRNDGSVFSWGAGSMGQLGNGVVYNSESIGVASPVQITQLQNIISIDAGHFHSLALASNGGVYAWGNGSTGNLGDGVVVNFDNGEEEHIVATPKKIPTLTGIKEISAGGFSLMRHRSGIVFACGSTFFGELGTGDSFTTNPYGQGKPTVVKNVDLDAFEDSRKGQILWEQWTNITAGITDIPTNLSPINDSLLTSFEAPFNIGDNYGSRIEGFLYPPVSGDYIFFISSDDHSELWLSNDEDPSNKIKIAYVNGNSRRNQWFKYPSQKSAKISLTAGKKYYIQALHKESKGVDHLSVGWELPNGQTEAPIPGKRLSVFSKAEYIEPVIQFTSPTSGAILPVNSPVSVTANGSYPHGQISKVEFYVNDQKVAEDESTPFSFTFTPIYEGQLKVVARAISSDATYGSSEIYLQAGSISNWCSSEGFVVWEQWNELPLGGIGTIPLNSRPSNSKKLVSFESKPNIGNFYGGRIKGYICPPVTGNYEFYISSDDYSELWLSTDSNLGNKVKIASITGATSIGQWDKYTSQKSEPILLVAGQQYYVEALHKENSGFDHLTVGWKLPDGTFEAPIRGDYLSPVLSLEDNSMARFGEPQNDVTSEDELTKINAYPNPFNDHVKLKFTADLTGLATLQIYDLNGALIHNVFEGKVEEGNMYEFDADIKERRGVFICRLTQGNKSINLKLIKF